MGTITAFESITRDGVGPASTMQQRLVRAKRRIRQARIPFVVLDRSAMPERLPPVLEAVCGCYALAFREWRTRGCPWPARRAISPPLSPRSSVTKPEAWSLASLLSLASARGAASTGMYLPLDAQDPADWDSNLIAEGEQFLRRTGPGREGRAPGRFQLEAAREGVPGLF